MANALYDLGREKFLTAVIDWATDNIKVVLVDSANYPINLATDEFLSDVPIAARVATSGNLRRKTTTAGVANSANVTLASVTGNESEAVVIYKDTGDPATSPLIAYIDTATGLPVTPNGSDVDITWNNGTNKIFKL